MLKLFGFAPKFLFSNIMSYSSGVIHSVKKHSRGDIIASIAVPPWAWYRSVEMWRHKDYPNVNWDQRMSMDMQSCIYFLSKAIDTESNNEDAIKQG